MSESPSFLRLSTISLFGYITFCLSIHQWTCSFSLLAIMNNASMNMSAQMSSLLSVLLGVCPEVELLDHVLTLF